MFLNSSKLCAFYNPFFEFSTNSFEGLELFLNCIIFTRNLGKIKQVVIWLTKRSLEEK